MSETVIPVPAEWRVRAYMTGHNMRPPMPSR